MKTIKIIINIIYVLLIIAIIYFLLNYKMYFVVSGSMYPTFKINELIVVEIASGNVQYEVGDIITFYDANIDADVSHRIVEINADGIYTKGDNNNIRDLNSITTKDIVGKVVWNSYFLGYFLLKYRYILIILLVWLFLAINFIFKKPNNVKGGTSEC